jgi:hypothetical protein
MGLHDQGLDIRKEITNAHASLEDYEGMFSKRKGSDGFRYDVCKDSTLVERIQKIYVVVYYKQKITNNIIGVMFTKVNLVEKRGLK